MDLDCVCIISESVVNGMVQLGCCALEWYGLTCLPTRSSEPWMVKKKLEHFRLYEMVLLAPRKSPDSLRCVFRLK